MVENPGEMKYLLMIVLLCTVTLARTEDVAHNYFNGNRLLEKCEAYINNTDIAEGNVCAGYISGISDLHETLVNWKILKQEKGWCKPVDVYNSQLVRIVTKFLQENPEHLHKGASGMVATALSEAFPCTDK